MFSERQAFLSLKKYASICGGNVAYCVASCARLPVKLDTKLQNHQEVALFFTRTIFFAKTTCTLAFGHLYGW